MKRKRMMDSMNLIDDRYVEEAKPGAYRPRRRVWFRVATVAACLAVALSALGLWMFLPFRETNGDVTQYRDSEYYEIIRKLDDFYQNRGDQPRNNFELYVSPIFQDGIRIAKMYSMDAVIMESKAETRAAGESWAYASKENPTDLQVSGVDETDLIKRTASHIFYVDDDDFTLFAYSIDGENSEAVGKYAYGGRQKGDYQHCRGMYLSEDGNTVFLILFGWDRDYPVTKLAVLDVSDPANITEQKCLIVRGSYATSRFVDGTVLLMTYCYFNKTPDYGDETTFIPQVDTGDGFCGVDADHIVCPERLSGCSYTVVSAVDAETLEILGTEAYLSLNENFYVSGDSVYLFRLEQDYVGLREVECKDAEATFKAYTYDSTFSKTVISRLGYRDGLRDLGSVAVKGWIKDQYSADEYEGVLRVVTTVDSNTFVGPESYSFENTVNASLYCVDTETMKVISAIESFAPAGESVRSVRFDGAMGYVCTSIQAKDPVFFFNLSDPENVTYTHTGTIEGFSTSLVNFTDGYLVGIGVGESAINLKIEVYKEAEDQVVSVCKAEKACWYSDDYKSYLIDRKNGLIGLGIEEESYYVEDDCEGSRYLLYRFDPESETLTEVCNIAIPGSVDRKRAVYIDGYLYVMSWQYFEVVSLDAAAR